MFEEIKDLTLEELEELKDETFININRISGQLEKAKTDLFVHRVFADQDWYRRAKTAVKMERYKLQSITFEIAQRRKAQKQVEQLSVEREFISICKKRLDQHLFSSLMEEANRNIGIIFQTN